MSTEIEEVGYGKVNIANLKDRNHSGQIAIG